MSEPTMTMPLVRKELRQILRGHGAFIVQILYLVIALVICAVASTTNKPSASWLSGASAFWILIYVETALVLVAGSAATAPALAAEYEQKTFDILASTPLRDRQVIIGKALGHFTTVISIVIIGLPVAAACYLLGGVPTGAAIEAHVLLYASVILAVSLGLYCSVMVRRSALAAPLAVAVGALILVVPTILQDTSAVALSAFSPIAAQTLASSAQAAPLFGWGAPGWLVALVIWFLACLTMLQGAVQGLRHPYLKRLWPVRWPLALLVASLAFLAMGSLGLKHLAGGAHPLTPERVAGTLAGYVTIFAYVLAILTVDFCAGLPTPLDKRRLQRAPLTGYSRLERACGFSLYSGSRYLMLLLLVALVIGEAGLALWGGGLFARWGGRLLLAFLPAGAALWACALLVRQSALWHRPRKQAGRRFLAALLLAAVLLIPPIVSSALSANSTQPGAAAELISTLTPAEGIAAALPSHTSLYSSAAMQALARTIPIPLVTTAWFLLLGAVLKVFEKRGRRRLMVALARETKQG